MRHRDTLWHDLVKAVGEGNHDEVGFIFAEILLDIRDVLTKEDTV